MAARVADLATSFASPAVGVRAQLALDAVPLRHLLLLLLLLLPLNMARISRERRRSRYPSSNQRCSIADAVTRHGHRGLRSGRVSPAPAAAARVVVGVMPELPVAVASTTQQVTVATKAAGATTSKCASSAAPFRGRGRASALLIRRL
jgi:hypothetical protein